MLVAYKGKHERGIACLTRAGLEKWVAGCRLPVAGKYCYLTPGRLYYRHAPGTKEYALPAIMQRNTALILEHVVRSAPREPGGDGGKAPGLLLLHGRGADELDLMGLADALDPRLTIVSARGPYRLG